MAEEVVVEKKACPQRGRRLKQSHTTVDVAGVRLISKNPGKPGTRFYGFFGAFLGKARRVATVRQMVESYWAMQDALGMTRDPEEQVLRDLANYISAWQSSDKTGSRGLHINVRRVDGSGRIARGEMMSAKYEFVSFKPDSPFVEKARRLGWPVAEPA
jgi:hypothetical protein